ncbi:hypothetical protein K388_02684 [Streptomyces sp. KhCrAH-43]|uniref:hypothetical protein n=1 Tax=unclassified Streptomyces TaxID=2593676 RepID=UPI00037422EB|nr:MULTISPECIES: hypothetical protein [unclassified Streptomyces]MYS36674.1 hypothetical protein [Streptomyces sp. SID4920]MYX69145.1 hypothetical protein [Streptomyces sp. SID8373]RAJ61998.1 hypothetical protein K388_02684 [Streptomyces sp. KhCrAH-43]
MGAGVVKPRPYPAQELSAPAPAEHSLEYAAFRELHEQVYLDYARLQTCDMRRAERAVNRAFAALCAGWSDALRSASLAAEAWKTLNLAVGSVDEHGVISNARQRCHLSDLQADAVRLYHQLGLSLPATAALMGTDDHTVRAAVSSAALITCSADPCRFYGF